MNRFILLSFDVEEFDMPLEYKFPITMQQQLAIGKQGLDAIKPILDDVDCTLFTTANFAVHFSDEIKQLSQKHEIASHTFYHSHFENKDLLSSKLKLEEIIVKPVIGLRMPRMRKVEMDEVKKAGYGYDSSINPTWIPGRYNNLSLPRTLYVDDAIERLPASVTPNFRIPLFWLSFKNMPYGLFRRMAIQTLKKDGYLSLYFHPWEFVNISDYNLPSYATKLCGEPLLQKLQKLIIDLKKEADFTTTEHWLKHKSPTT